MFCLERLMDENKNIKRKLIIQSFMPLYFILVIKNFDEEMLILVKNFIMPEQKYGEYCVHIE